MAFFQMNYHSDALGMGVSVNVILPEADQGIGVDASKVGALPKVLYLLHGYSDDHSIWMRRTSVERYAAQHNLAVHSSQVFNLSFSTAHTVCIMMCTECRTARHSENRIIIVESCDYRRSVTNPAGSCFFRNG